MVMIAGAIAEMSDQLREITPNVFNCSTSALTNP